MKSAFLAIQMRELSGRIAAARYGFGRHGIG